MGRPQLLRGAGDRPATGPRPGRARRRQGRPRLDPRQHPPGVDLLRLRGALDRRHRGPDLPDQLTRGVPLRPRELRRQGRRRRGRRTAGEDPRGPRPAAPAGADRADDRLQRGRALDGGPRRQGRRGRPGPLGVALLGGDPGRHLHLHLHLRHHRPAQGLHHQPRQLPRDAGHGQRDQRHRGRRRQLPLPAAGPLLRPADPARQLRPRRHDRLLGARSAEDPPQPGRAEADLLPLGAAHLREDLHRRQQRHGKRGRPQKDDLQLGDRRRREDARGRAQRAQARLPARAPVRLRRREGALENPQPLRRQAAPRRLRRRPDQPRDPALLRRRRSARARGLGDDRDLDRGDDLHARTTSRSARSANRSPAAR